MSHGDRAADRQAIERLNHDFCHHLDRGNVEDFVALFTEDAHYSNGPRVLRGERQIRQFYIDRSRTGPRTSRHFIQGLRIEFTDEKSARGLSAAFTFAADGSPPIESTIPAMVADFQDVYAFDGVRWRFAERHVVPLFRAPPSR